MLIEQESLVLDAPLCRAPSAARHGPSQIESNKQLPGARRAPRLAWADAQQRGTPSTTGSFQIHLGMGLV